MDEACTGNDLRKLSGRDFLGEVTLEESPKMESG